MLARGMANPTHILAKLSGTNSRETNPRETLGHVMKSAAETERLFAVPRRLRQIVDSLNLEGFWVYRNNVNIDGSEVQKVVVEKAFVWTLNSDVDLARWVVEADGFALVRTSYPEFIAQLKNIVSVGAMRLGGRNLTVIDVAGVNAPCVLAHHVPGLEQFSIKRDCGDNVESCDRD